MDPPPTPDGVAPDDPAVIIWTSGTTGLPKGAWFDHRNLAAAVRTAGVMSEPFDRRIAASPWPMPDTWSSSGNSAPWGSPWS